MSAYFPISATRKTSILNITRTSLHDSIIHYIFQSFDRRPEYGGARVSITKRNVPIHPTTAQDKF